MPRVAVVLDTNIFLHYQPLDNIPWPDLLDADQVTLVVPHVVVEELDDQKDAGSTGRKRERARKALKSIRGAITDAGSDYHFSDSVHLEHLEDPADFNYEEAGLREDKNDHRVIATTLALHSRDDAMDSVALAAGDVGPQILAENRNLECLDLEEYRLSILSPAEKEKRELERRLQELKASAPELSVVIENGEAPDRIEATIPPPKDFDEEAKDDYLSLLREKYPEKTGENTALHSVGLTGMIPDEEYERYNRQREDYFERVEKYMRAQHDLENMWRRSARLKLRVLNDGKAPAKNIEVVLEIPDGPVPIADDDFPTDDFDEPEPPRPPRTALERAQSSLTSPQNLGRLLANVKAPPPSPFPGSSRGWDIEEVNSYRLTREIQQIRQKRDASLDPFWLLFPEDVEPQSFTMAYRIVADPVPGEITGDLHFVVRD